MGKHRLSPFTLSTGRYLFAVVTLSAVLLVFHGSHDHAGAGETMEFGSSPNPVGSGARALGMGGAFIALADDATAASWNPGGLIQLEKPELSAVGAGFQRSESNTFQRAPESSGEQTVSKASLNYLSAAYPVVLGGRNMVFSLNYQHLYDFDREWKNLRLPVGNIAFEQEGALYAYGLAYCVQLIPSLSAGFTLNLWQDGPYENGWTQKIYWDGSLFSRDHYSFQGFNANLGALWSPTGRLSLGAVVKMPFTAGLEHSHYELYQNPATVTLSEELDMPMSYGLGVVYRFTDRLIAALDIYRTHWQDFVLKGPEGNRSAVSGLPESQSSVDATTQVRLGGEYFFIKPPYTIPLRAGFFYDPAPAEGSPDTFLGFSLGSGINIGRFIFDFAYQYRFGSDVGSSILRNLRFSQDVDEHTFYSSVIVQF